LQVVESLQLIKIKQMYLFKFTFHDEEHEQKIKVQFLKIIQRPNISFAVTCLPEYSIISYDDY